MAFGPSGSTPSDFARSPERSTLPPSLRDSARAWRVSHDRLRDYRHIDALDYCWQATNGLFEMTGAVFSALEQFNAVETYIRDGENLIYNRLISQIPNQMVPENSRQERVIRLLTRNRLETQATNADGVTTVLVYTRVE